MKFKKKDYKIIELKKRKNYFRRAKLKKAKIIRKISTIILSIFLVLFIIIFISKKFKLKKVQKIISFVNNNPLNQKKFLINNNTLNKNNYLINNNSTTFNYIQGNNPSICDILDPIFMLGERLNTKPIQICENQITKHICYSQTNIQNVHRMATKNGVICTVENMVIDPSKWMKENNNTDNKNNGAPLLSKGFYNTKCDNVHELNDYAPRYKQYFNGWDYDYKEKMEDVEELAPGKTIFLLNRNYNSANMYHGGCEIVNAVCLMYLLNLKPEDIKVIFLESFDMTIDPFYDLYKNLISRGGEPVYAKNLNKKYHISHAVLVPINYDSPLFKSSHETECSFPTKTFQFFNFLIDKYLNINYKDNFISDGEIYFYPKTTLDNYSSNTVFTKSVTIQWRKLWPKNRKSQGRLNGNGPELAEKLASLLPKNFLVRLVNTADLPIAEQIAIARSSNYFIGIHGAGLFLTIFSPKDCIVHEILHKPYNSLLRIMSGLSGHKTYSTIIKSNVRDIDGKSFIDFDPERFAENIIAKMKRNNFFD